MAPQPTNPTRNLCFIPSANSFLFVAAQPFVFSIPSATVADDSLYRTRNPTALHCLELGLRGWIDFTDDARWFVSFTIIANPIIRVIRVQDSSASSGTLQP
jgi:hypothetical protein